ncbi:MAG: ComF family protein [Acidimicrobiia bacterium]
MGAIIRRILREVVDLWLPPVCAVCRAAECVVCPSCLGSLVSADRLAPPAGLDEVLALLRYDECSRPLVLALKSHGRRDVAEIVGPALARLLDPLRLESAVPTVTWAPTTAGHRRSRGYDPSGCCRSIGGGDVERGVGPTARSLEPAVRPGRTHESDDGQPWSVPR